MGGGPAVFWALDPMVPFANRPDDARHEHRRASSRVRIRTGRGRPGLSGGCGTAGQSHSGSGITRSARGSASSGQRRLVSAGCRRRARCRRAARPAPLASPVAADGERAAPRAGGSPHGNTARRCRLVRPLCSRVSGRAIDGQADHHAEGEHRPRRRQAPRNRPYGCRLGTESVLVPMGSSAV
jgi:hypothetical protein